MKMKQLKIALVAPYDFNRIDGNTLRPLMQAKGLLQNNQDVTIFCLKKNPNIKINQREINKGFFSFIPKSLRFPNSDFLFDLPFVSKIQGLHRYEIVHAHNYYSYFLIPKKDFIMDLHTFKANEVRNTYKHKKGFSKFFFSNYSYKKIKQIERKILRATRRVIVAGQNIKDEYKKEFGIVGNNIFVANNCLDTSVFKKNNHTKKFNIGVIGPFKHMNRELLKHVLALSSQTKAEITLVGDIESEDKSVVANMKNIKCLGRVSDKDYQRLMSEFSVVLLPYFNLRQGGGLRNKVIEPAACGTPIITTKAGAEGFDEGLLYIGANYGELLKHIKTLKSKSVRLKNGAKLRKKVRQEYDYRSVSKKLVEIYSK